MKRLAAAAALVLALTGCAVTGQPAGPSVVAEWNGVTVTTADVAAYSEAFDALDAPADPGAIVTMLLLKPTVDQLAADNDLLYSDAELDSDAQMWIAAAAGEQVPVTDTMRDAVRQTKSVWDLVNTPDAALPIVDVANTIQAEAVSSPLIGDFSATQWATTINNAYTSATNQQAVLGPVAYLELRNTSGYTPNAQQSWMVGEQPATAPAAGDSAVPSATPAP